MKFTHAECKVITAMAAVLNSGRIHERVTTFTALSMARMTGCPWRETGDILDRLGVVSKGATYRRSLLTLRTVLGEHEAEARAQLAAHEAAAATVVIGDCTFSG